MTGLRWVQLPEDERNEFLSDGGTGVLSFARGADESPTSLPVSFVVHGETDAGWRSVVATGTLEELAELPEESAAVQRMWAVSIPTVDMFDRPRDEIPFHDFRLVPETISGRKEAV